MVKIPFIDYDSTEYGLISGPLFTVVYTITAVIISYFGGSKVSDLLRCHSRPPS